MRINVQMIAAFDDLYTRFSNVPDTVAGVALDVMDGVGQYLAGRVQANLSGPILKTVSGRLRDSIKYRVYEVNGMITAHVYSDGSVPYSVIQNKGGRTSPHDIVVKNAQALRFMFGPYAVFAKAVHHPGSRIKPALYMERTMNQERSMVLKMVKQGMSDALRT